MDSPYFDHAVAGLSGFLSDIVAMAAADPLGFFLQVFILVSGLYGNYLIANRNSAGFFVWIAANIALVWVSWQEALFGMVLLYIIYSGMCLYGIRKWKASEPDSLQLKEG